MESSGQQPPAGGDPASGSRRPLKTREKPWAHALARALAKAGLSPNAISALSVIFAAGALVLFLLAPDFKSKAGGILAYLGAAACIQLRLLANLLDGLVAVECGKKSPLGGLWNEVPDRIADVLILVGAGYSTSIEPGVVKLFDALPLGWCCAVAALWTAYIRSIGAELAGRHFFCGPMAKPHRMAALTLGCIAAAVFIAAGKNPHPVLLVTLAVILFFSLVTCWLRLRLIAGELRR